MVSRNYDLSQTPSDSILIFPDVPAAPPSAGSFLGAVTSSTKLAQLGFFAPGAVYIPIAGGTMSGPLILSGNPVVALGAVPKQYADLMLPLAGGQMAGPLSLAGDATLPLHAVTFQQINGKLNISGGTMTGPLILSGAPTIALHSSTKAYVDAQVSGATSGAAALYLPLAGGTLTGPVILSGDGTLPLHPATKQQLDTKLAIAGGTMTGFLFLNADPTNLTHASTKRYTDTQISSSIAGLVGVYLPIAGGTLTGALTAPSITTPLVNLGSTNDAWTNVVYDTFVWSIRDGSGNIALALDASGLLWIAGIPAATNANQPVTASYVTANFLPLTGGTLSGNLGLVGNATYQVSTEPGLVWSIRDGHGNIAVALDGTGTLFVANLNALAGGSAVLVPNPPFALPTTPGASGTWWNNGTFICVVP